VKLKFNPLAEVKGKRIVAVDDTIVRGNTTRQIVQMLFEAGAAEVHLRISAPPIVSQCYYGIDFAQEDELIAAGRTVEGVRGSLGSICCLLSGRACRKVPRPVMPACIAGRGTKFSVARRAPALCRTGPPFGPRVDRGRARAAPDAARPPPRAAGTATRARPG